MAASFYPDDDPTSSIDNEPTDDDEEDETVINAQETISAALRLATNLNNRGLLPDVFLRHLRNAVLRLTEPEDDGFEDSLEDNIPPDGSDAPGSQDCCCGRPLGVLQTSRAVSPGTVQSPESSFGEAWGWQNPAIISKPEDLTLSDSTREFWDRGMKSLARSPPPPPCAAYPGSGYGASQAYTPYRTGAVPRRLFPDPGGRFPCECESPATPCLVTGPIPWTPSPAGAGPAQTASSPGSSYKGLPLSPRRPVQSRISSPASSRGVAPSPGTPCSPECTVAGSSPYTSGSIPWLPSPDSSLVRGPSGEPMATTTARAPRGSSRRGTSAPPMPSPDSQFRGSWPGEAVAASRSPMMGNRGRNATSPTTTWGQEAAGSAPGQGRVNSTWTQRSRSLSPDSTCQYHSVPASQFMPEINSTNLSGSWGTPSRVTSTRSPVTPAESSYAAEQSSGPIPAWRINADRNAMRGAGGVHSWSGSPRSRSLSPARRRRRPVAEFEFVPSEDSSMGERSWRSRSSGPRSPVPRISFPNTTADFGQANVLSAQCPTCEQSADGRSGVMHTFAGIPSTPQVCPLDCRRNWSISPAGAHRGELSREESWRNY